MTILIKLKSSNASNPKNIDFNNKLKQILGKSFEENDFKDLISSKDELLKEKIINKFHESRKKRVEILNEEQSKEIEKKIVISSNPFPNTIIKNTLPKNIIKKAEDEFINFSEFNSEETYRYGRAKYYCANYEIMPNTIKDIISFFYSQKFLNLLEKNLIYKIYCQTGGCMERAYMVHLEADI